MEKPPQSNIEQPRLTIDIEEVIKDGAQLRELFKKRYDNQIKQQVKDFSLEVILENGSQWKLEVGMTMCDYIRVERKDKEWIINQEKLYQTKLYNLSKPIKSKNHCSCEKGSCFGLRSDG